MAGNGKHGLGQGGDIFSGHDVLDFVSNGMNWIKFKSFLVAK